jgi:hypothetical protein
MMGSTVKTPSHLACRTLNCATAGTVGAALGGIENGSCRRGLQAIRSGRERPGFWGAFILRISLIVVLPGRRGCRIGGGRFC